MRFIGRLDTAKERVSKLTKMEHKEHKGKETEGQKKTEESA